MSERIDYFKCEHCDMHSPKEAWGAGRTMCVNCNMRAPTAEQHHLNKHEIWNGVDWVANDDWLMSEKP
jgi:hypothetical protein